MFLIHMYDNHDNSHVTTFAIGCSDVADQLNQWILDIHYSTKVEEASVEYSVEYATNRLTEDQKDIKQELLKRFFEETHPTEIEHE